MLAYALVSKPCSEATDIGYYMALFRNPNIIRYNLIFERKYSNFLRLAYATTDHGTGTRGVYEPAQIPNAAPTIPITKNNAIHFTGVQFFFLINT